MDFLQGLNDRQREAVLKTEGPLLIMAGAGSGKTRVVTHKIAYLIEEKKIFPGNILAITFTNKAANEMKERVAKLLNTYVDRMWIGTFHAICVRILRRDIDKIGYNRSFTIYDRTDQITLIKECIKELDVDKEIYKESNILAKISSLKDAQISPDEHINQHYTEIYERNMGELYALYVKKLKEYNALDFDDLILKAVELLKNNKDILGFYQKKFQYVFVDEYQDTNRIQYEFAKLLSGWHGNICVVGDQDQSIYSWRGADISNIIDFEKDFKGAETILLEQNYRSTQKILEVANNVIKNNRDRKEKNLWTSKDQGEDILYERLSSSDEEASYVANKIHHLIYKGYKASEIAILYRTNAQSRTFEHTFFKEEIPYKIIGGLKFYDRKEVKDIIAYLRLIQNPQDNISLKRIINTPRRGIGNTTLEKVETYASNKNISIYEALSQLGEMDNLSTRAKNSVEVFYQLINGLRGRKENLKLKDLVEETIERSGYLEDLSSENTIEAKSRIDNIRELISAAASFKNEGESYGDELEDFLASIALLSDTDDMDDEDKKIDTDNKVTMMTVHSAKGLEFKAVFLVGMEEGLFPISRSFENDEDLEEERRLCYVAVTRAEEVLFITSATSRMIYGSWTHTLPSRFIEEMGHTIERKEVVPEKRSPIRIKVEPSHTIPNIFRPKPKKENIRLELGIGTKIRHKKFGIGMVVQIKEKENDKEITIVFDKGGLKKLSLSLAPIEVI